MSIKEWLSNFQMPLSLLRESAVAAPAKNEVSLKESSITIDEGSVQEKDGKRNVVVTLMREGPGNKRDMNWYHRQALESLVKLILDRPKNFFDHVGEGKPEHSVKDWASSVREAWVEEEGAMAVAKAKVEVLDDWLWERAKRAPGELAMSVEGRGVGVREKIGGVEYNGIHEISALAGVMWVDYPGNAGMGVTVLEKSRGADAPEEDTMDLKGLLEMVKGATPDEKKQLAEALGSALVESAGDPAAMKALETKVAEMKAASDADKKALGEKLAAIEAEKTALANKVEAHSLKEVEVARERMVETLLKASRLKEEHKTETFRSTLLAVRETKRGDAAITEEAQMKQLIADREKICIAEVADPAAKGGKPSDLSEAQQSIAFTKRFFGQDVSEVYKHPELVGEDNVIQS